MIQQLSSQFKHSQSFKVTNFSQSNRKSGPRKPWEGRLLPVSVEWPSDIKRIGTGFVVSRRAKSIHKAAVGKRSLCKQNKSVYTSCHQRTASQV